MRKLDLLYGVIILVTVASHGLLLLNDGIYWDGWLVYSFLLEKDWNTMAVWTREAGGGPVNLYLRWFLGALPGVILGYRLAVFGAILCAAVFVYATCKEMGLLGRWESLFIALLSIVYPAYQVSIEINTAKYQITYAFFLMAVFMALRSERSSGWARYGLRLGALCAFALCFGTASLLVFYFGFLFLMLVYVQRLKGLSLKEMALGFLPARVDYLVLPFVYWSTSRFFFPQRGLYVNENQISFTLDSLRSDYDLFFQQAVRWQWEFALRRVIELPTLGLLTALVALGAFWVWRRQSAPLFESRVNTFVLLGFGIVCLLGGMFPYVAVGDLPDLSGWTTRHALLVGLPVGIIVVALARLVFAHRFMFLQQFGFTVLVILVWVFTLSTINYDLDWQARWVKDRSVMLNLSRLPESGNYSVYWVDDQFPLGGEPSYRFYEYSSMFKQIWGAETRIGVDVRAGPEYLRKIPAAVFTHLYNLADLDPGGCQAMLTIRQGLPAYSALELAARYPFYRFFRSDTMEAFLARVTVVQVQPVVSPSAVNCRAR